MGVCMSRIHFENGLPTVGEIQEQFKKQTGLNFSITANLNLLELPLNNKDVVEKLNEDIGKYEDFERKEFGDIKKMREESKKINYISCFQLYNYRFYGIDFHVEGNAIEMLYGVGRFYFPTSLNKCLFDLGGRFVDTDNQPTKGWEWTKVWKKLKHWDDYKWYNRPRK